MTESGWPLVVQTALLGTERAGALQWQAVPDGVAPYLAAIDSSDAEAALLSGAALLGTYAHVGRLPARATDTLPAPAPLDDDDLPVAPPGVVRLLTLMLAGTHEEAVGEWLVRTAQRGWRVPSIALPSVLGLGTRLVARRPAIIAVLGARGRWLAEQNDEWHWASGADVAPEGEALTLVWETETPALRAELLTSVRRVNPARGLALLESTWSEESPANRAMLLPRLATGLGDDDESFLERARDDRRAEVRRAACDLLATLSTSALVSRMTERARALLRYEEGRLLRGAKLYVEPPAVVDGAAVRDGVEKAPPVGTGERAWWLAQIVAAVPPGTWSTDWRAEPKSLVKLAATDEWARPLLDGWGAAAVRFRDAAWAEALLTIEADVAQSRTSRIAPSPTALVTVLDPARREAIITAAIHKGSSDVVQLLLDADHHWSEAFALVVLDSLRERAAQVATTVADGGWRLRDVMPQLALHMPVSVATHAAHGWPLADGDSPHPWTKAIERFLSLLTFRNDIAEEFTR